MNIWYTNDVRFELYKPIYDAIGVLAVDLRDIYPYVYIFKCASRKRFRRNK